MGLILRKDRNLTRQPRIEDMSRRELEFNPDHWSATGVRYLWWATPWGTNGVRIDADKNVIGSWGVSYNGNPVFGQYSSSVLPGAGPFIANTPLHATYYVSDYPLLNDDVDWTLSGLMHLHSYSGANTSKFICTRKTALVKLESGWFGLTGAGGTTYFTHERFSSGSAVNPDTLSGFVGFSLVRRAPPAAGYSIRAYVNGTYLGYYDGDAADLVWDDNENTYSRFSWNGTGDMVFTPYVMALRDYEYNTGTPSRNYQGINNYPLRFKTVPAKIFIFPSKAAVTPTPALGSTAISKLYLGSTEAQKAYLGSTLILDNTP